ncbi:hypothetical protein [Aeoliella mucimassa]|uniref:PEP-CTERM protein-sorting domain-containing protein n=1 Tax=Aeoliella mucimassa TaxID=2527972 RepID=A0A518AGU9_9BACT|nr:hypothetical protein [Aeoliella mucimassa]QDU53963.1 hypothetical protein Pan181_01420 [Aeoliella mucimassa]
MHTTMKLSLVALLVATASMANAAIQGPTYPAPGGNNWSGNGISGTEGTAVWNYSNFDTNSFSDLYFGLNQLDYGDNGAGLDGSVAPFTFSSASGQTATWTANTTWYNDVTNVPTAATTRLVMTVSGLGANPWITDLASIGLDTGFGDLGAVVDNSSGSDFSLSWSIEANIGSGWQPLNGPSGVPQSSSHSGYNRSSFATGFYYNEAVVPEPATMVVWTILGLSTGVVVYRRRVKS